MIEHLPPRFEAAVHSQRLTDALELLGHSLQSRRLAGIYALEALRRDVPETGGAVVEILSSFVRRQAAWDPGLGEPKAASTEVQAALAALGRQARSAWEDRPLDLHGIALKEAYLPLAHFERAFLYDCDFEGALLVGARLDGAWLARTNLRNANLDDAHLEGADLSNARNMTKYQLARVHIDSHTRLPTALQPNQTRNIRSRFQHE
jgi:hypothetical protein